MIPVLQHVHGPQGDCVHASLASVTEIPYPSAFCFPLPPMLEILIEEFPNCVAFVNGSVPENFHAVVGIVTDEGVHHAVVGYFEVTEDKFSVEVVHDPAGTLMDPNRYTILSVMVVLPLKNSIAVKI